MIDIIIKLMNSADFPFSKQYQWENREEIGRGGFATIYKVKSRVNNQFYAIKQLDMARFDTEYKLQSIRNQIYLMKQCKAINLVEMFNFYVGPTFTYIVLQLCEIDLKEIINQRNNLTEIESINILIDIVKGYKVLVQKNYIHRDIKPENVLVKNKIYKLTDYGFSRKTKFEFQKFRQVCGTAIYMAPQLFYGKQYTSKCDIWSLGLVLYESIFGFSPWTNKCLQTYKSDIVTRQVSFPYNCRIGINTKNFIQRCLQLEEEDRMSFKQLYQHPLIKDRNPGPPLFHRQFNEKVLRILGRMQRSSSKKLINIRSVFHKYQNYKGMDEKTFYHFLIELDPQITTYESQQIFHSADFSGDGIIHVDQFRSFYIEVDYRPSSDIASKRIQDIAKMAQARNLTIKELFDMIDLNKNRIIQQKQFQGFISHIAPKLSFREIDQIFRKFDKNNSKAIEFQQFIRQLTRDNQNKQKIQIPNFQRALRNVQCLKMHFLYSKKSPQEILNYDQMRDSKCKGMSLDEFGKKVRSINYVISRDQIVEMFRLIDHDCSQSISLSQLYKLMQKQPY